MGEATRQLKFKAPLQKVWQVWTDVEKTPQWVEGVRESQITSPIREGKGLAWKEKCLFGKQIIQMDHEVKEWEPLKKTRVQTGLPMGGTMESVVEFKNVEAWSPHPSSGGQTLPPHETEVVLHLEWDLGMVGMIIGEEKLQHMMEKSLDLTLQKWKAQAEGQ